MTKRDEYIARMKKQLDELNATMSSVEASAKEVRDDAKAKFKEEMAELRHQSKAVAAKLDGLKAAGDDTWDAAVGEMEKLRDAFVHSFNYFKSRL